MRNIKGRIKKIYSHHVFMSFLINAIFLLLVVLFCDMKYEVSDDFIVDSILSGHMETDMMSIYYFLISYMDIF